MKNTTSYKSIVAKFLILIIAGFSLAACVVKPIYNVEDRAFNTEEIIPLDTIQRRIKIIGAHRGWAFKDIAPGHMLGSVGTGKHNAEVDLYFNQKTFSIKYHDSHNLKAADGTIHHRYNRWVEILEGELSRKVGLLQEQ